MDDPTKGGVKSLAAYPEFSPYASWSEHGQMLFVFLKDEPGIDVRVDDSLTLIMNSRNEVVGAKLSNHGLRRVFERMSAGQLD